MAKVGHFGLWGCFWLLATFLGSGAANAQDTQSVSISASGTPGYTAQIAVPPGVGGMAPQLALLYTASNINGPVGVGWTLQGISAITRCGANKQIDGVARAVAYGPDDKLCLDGQRLIQVDPSGVVVNDAIQNPSVSNPFQTGDSLGGSGQVREYRTEKDIYSRIRAYGSAGGDPANGPAYFKVWTKSGQVFEYGVNANVTSNAAITASGKNLVTTWAVSRISDTVGNYIDFQYSQRESVWGTAAGPLDGYAGREWNLVEVRYTGNGGQEPLNRLVLTYAERGAVTGDRAEAFHQGSKTINLSRLDSIRTYVNWPASQADRPQSAVKVKTYKIAYENGPRSGRSRVTRIVECGGENENICLPAPTFEYSDGSSAAFTANPAFAASALASATLRDINGKYGVLTGGFFGSGRTDLIRWSENPAENQIYRSNGDGTFAQVPNGSSPGQFNLTDVNLAKADGCYSSEVADFNGDGAADILRTMKISTACGPARNVLYISNGDGSFNARELQGIDLSRAAAKITIRPCEGNCDEGGTGTNQRTPGQSFYLLDLNNDGLLDIVTAKHPGWNIGVGEVVDEADLCGVIVCTQVYIQQSDGAFVEKTNTNVAHRILYVLPPQPRQVTGRANAYVADFNGDGLTDIAAERRNWLSRGDGDFDESSGTESYCSYLLDFNGDGRMDCLSPNDGMPAYNGLALANGKMVAATRNFNLSGEGDLLLRKTTGTEIRTVDVAPLDIDGDGRTDILRVGDDAAMNTVFLSNGDGTFRRADDFNLTDQLRSSDGKVDFVVGDFTGQGTVELLRVAAEGGNALYVKQNPTPPDQLRSVTSPTGLKTELTWVTLTHPFTGDQDPRYYHDFKTSSGAVYPLRDVAVPMSVVARTVADSGVRAEKQTTDYLYAGMKASYNGLGMLGFREVRQQTRTTTGKALTVLNEYLQDGYNTGLALLTRTWIGDLWGRDGSPEIISETWNIYCDKTAAAGALENAYTTGSCVPGSRVRRPFLYVSSERGWEKGVELPTVQTVNTYNDDGDPTEIRQSITGNAVGQAQHFVKTTTNTYYPANKTEDKWLLGRLQRATVTADHRSDVQGAKQAARVAVRSAMRLGAATTLPAPATQQGPGAFGVVYARDVVAAIKSTSGSPDSIAKVQTAAGSAPYASANKGVEFSMKIDPATVDAYANVAGMLWASPVPIITGGIPPYRYQWTAIDAPRFLVGGDQLASPVLSAVMAINETVVGTFKLTVRDAAQAEISTIVKVTLTASSGPVAVTIEPTTLRAKGIKPGMVSGGVTATAKGGLGPYSFAWTRVSGTRSTISDAAIPNPVISADLSDGVAVNDSWQVAVTDSAGKKATRNVSLDFTVPRLLATNLPATANVTATAESAGIATFTMASNTTGGTAPYTYSWVRAEGSRSTISDASAAKPSIAFPLTVGETVVEKWTVTVTDSVGYATSSTVAIRAAYPATAMKLTFSPSSPRMDAADPGAVSVEVASVLTGGVPPYTYAWTPYNGTKTAVSNPAAATVSIGATLAAGQTVAEMWRLTVTDATAKTIANSVTVTLTAPAPLTAPLVATRSITASAASGGVAVTTLSVTPSGGRAPYTYQWQRTTGSRSTATNDTTANATIRFALNVGETLTENWSVTVADAAGHAVTSEVAITATYPATALALSFSPSSPRVDAPDPGPASVAVTGMPTGGIPPYTYAWTINSGTQTTVADRTAATARIAATLTAGQTLSESWRLTVTDTAGKSIAGTVTATLTAPAPLVAKLPASYSMTATASSGGLAKAPVSVTVSGGRAPYSYSWSRTSGSRSTVADDSVASATISFQLNLGETVTENWTVTVQDAAGHTASATIALTGTYPGSALQVTFPATSVRNDAPDPGPASVTLSANVAGGIPPYTYAWARYTGSKTSTPTPAAANPVVSANVAAGETFSETWRLTVTDSAGKSAASNVTVTMSAPAPMSYPLPANSTASVGTASNSGVSSMQIGTSLTGGRTPYTYDWTRLSGSRSAASSETISNPLIKATLTVGETLTERWRVRITDSVGHVISAETDIAFAYPAPPISVSLQPASLSVVGNDPGVVTGTTKIVASGGIPPYSYGWVRTTGSRATVDNAASSTPVFSATLNAAESISEQWKATVTDSAGKSQAVNLTTAFSVLAPLTAKATASSENVTVTASNTTGKSTLSATATGGKSPYTYAWGRTAGGAGTLSSTTVTNPVLSVTLGEGQSAAEAWEVTVRDAVGHVASATVSVQFAYPYPKLVVTSTPTAVTQTVKVAGPSSVPVHIAVTGGLAPYTYNWQRTSGSGAQLAGSNADVSVSFNFVGPERTVDEWRVDVTDARGSKGSTLLRSTFAYLGIKQECTREDAAHFRCDVYNWTGVAQSQVHIGFDQSGLQVNPLNFYNCAANSYCGTYRVQLMPGSHSGTIYSMAGSYTSTGYTFNETVK